MGAVLKSQDDPRSPLQRMRRYELINYARANGIPNVTDNVPAIIIRKLCAAKGLRGLMVRRPPLGSVTGSVSNMAVLPDVQVNEIDADADLERQFLQALPAPVPAAAIAVQPERKSPATMTIIELGNEMKRLGIKRERRDNMITMRQKIEAHG